MERAALEGEGVLDDPVPTRRAGAEQSSKHRGGSSWLRPSRRGSRLIRSRHPPKHMPKLTKSYQKVVKMEPQRGVGGLGRAPSGMMGI